MAKKLVDNFADSKWVGATVKLTPNDKVGSPEDFEKLYERRQERRAASREPSPKLKPIEHSNMSELLERVGLGDG